MNKVLRDNILDFESTFGERIYLKLVGMEETPNGPIHHLKGHCKREERDVYAYIDFDEEVIEERPEEFCEAMKISINSL